MLPLRGVMASALLCPPTAGAAQHAHASHASDGGLHDSLGDSAPHHAQGDSGAGAHHHDGASGPDTCKLCSVCCSAPPLPSAVLSVPPPHALAAAGFPAVGACASSFLSDGQDRPPRSI
ncbi:MAG: hypothetical protein KGL43_01245 [Burkholderiales bacterium]|nr:hypothetical protein [Burkholderiales bacterium]MDE2452193.1 hypothetical protein [Burkholderiales bacterium]